MTSFLFRATAGTLAGSVLGVLALLAMYPRSATITMEMDRPAPVRGLFDVERLGTDTWAWSGADATLTLPGLDRRLPWVCTIRVRGARSDASLLPEALVSVDGVIATRHQTTNDYQDLRVTLPPRPSDGATVTLTSSRTVEPGGGDRRALGVMVDRWACAPDGGLARPPRQGLLAAAIAGSAFGLAFALAGLGLWLVIATTAVIAVAQAVALCWEFGMFAPYVGRVAWLGIGIAAAVAAGVRATEWWTGPFTRISRVVVAFTAAILFLKLLVLLHPSKPPVDVIFHAHRLGWVLEGRYFFTQPMPSGVQFPYAIGLYVFALPWTAFTRDYVLILRIVVSAAEAAGALLVYFVVLRQWGDRVAGAIAALLFALVPREFEILGNANLTNAFGQCVALAAVVAAVQWRLGRRHWRQFAGYLLVTAFALLCHVSTLSLLSSVLVFLALLYWWRREPDLRPASIAIGAGLAVAAILSVVLYYAHFMDAFRSAARIRATAPQAGAAGTTEASIALSAKVLEAARLAVAAVGWPIMLLAVCGAVIWWRRGLRDRLSLAIAAWALTFFVFVVAVVLLPVGASFLRYAAEFISRVTLATYPAMVILAGLGGAVAMRGRLAARLAAAALITGALYNGAQLWLDWLR